MQNNIQKKPVSKAKLSKKAKKSVKTGSSAHSLHWKRVHDEIRELGKRHAHYSSTKKLRRAIRKCIEKWLLTLPQSLLRLIDQMLRCRALGWHYLYASQTTIGGWIDRCRKTVNIGLGVLSDLGVVHKIHRGQGLTCVEWLNPEFVKLVTNIWVRKNIPHLLPALSMHPNLEKTLIKSSFKTNVTRVEINKEKFPSEVDLDGLATLLGASELEMECQNPPPDPSIFKKAAKIADVHVTAG